MGAFILKYREQEPIMSNIVDALNSIKSNVWAVVLILVGCVLVLHGHESVGGSLSTGGFAVFRNTAEESHTDAKT